MAKASAKTSAAPGGSPASRPVKKGDHVFLVDGSGYIFRAYHALPPLNRKSDGLQVNAVLGFCNMLWKLLRDMKPEDRPTHLAVIFDKSERTFRNELYKDYKAHRPDAPDDLIPQFPLIREAVRAFDIPCLEMLGFEADDLIATYARQACAVQANVTIVSSDKDLMQLVNDCVIMYDTMKDKKIGIAEVIEKFGVPPEKVIEVQALIGDSSDNVPGVPGIGVKTAAQLIGEYGDLETLLRRAGEIKQQKRRESLIEHAEKARISKVLVTLDQNVKLETPLAELVVHEPDHKRLIAFLKQMEFSTLTRRVAEFAQLDSGAIEPSSVVVAKTDRPAAATAAPSLSPGLPLTGGGMTVKPRPGAATPDFEGVPQTLAAARLETARNEKIDRPAYEVVRSLEALNAWIDRARDAGVVAINVETVGDDPMQAALCGIALAVAPNQACYVPLAHRKAGNGGGLFDGGLAPDQISEASALAALKALLEAPGVLKVGQNLKFELQLFAVRGIELRSHEDTMLMSYVLDAGRFGHGIDALAPRYFSHAAVDYNDVIGSGKSRVTFDCVAFEKAAPYVAEDADIALRLTQVLRPRMVAEHVTGVYETLERPLLPVLARMERHGISVDRQVLSRLSGEFAQRAAGLEAEIRELAGDPAFNPGSPKQLGDILFGKMGLEGGVRTKSGQWSTGARVLDELAEQGHVLPQRILEWRQVTKLKSTYTDALPGYINPATKRVHTNYALAATPTGRLSSSEPNLQNIPIRTEEGRKIRRAFVASQGHKLVSADYSQIELRLLAEIAEVPALRQAFKEGLDIHALTASEMFGVPVKGMPADVRRRAKAINFGIIYGISAFGLANQLAIPREEAGAYIKKYFERFPGIRDYMEETKAFAKKNGYVLTLFGRKCHYPDIVNSNPSVRAFNERAAINARLQGSAADIIRRAMIRMEGALAKKKLNAQMLLQVHDELVFEVSLSVPLAVDAHAADNWDEAH
jgi:DNA polymerase-1